MGNRPAPLGARRHERRFAARRRPVEHKLDPQPPDGIDDRVDLRVVLPRLELEDARLREAKLLRQGPLAQLVLGAIAQQGCRKLPRRSEPLPLRPKARIGKLLLGQEGIEVLSGSSHRDHDNSSIIGGQPWRFRRSLAAATARSKAFFFAAPARITNRLPNPAQNSRASQPPCFGRSSNRFASPFNDFICGDGRSDPRSFSFCTTLKTALRSPRDLTSSKSITASLSKSTIQALGCLPILRH